VNVRESLPQWLQWQLDRREWSQADFTRELSRAAGRQISTGLVSNWLTGARRPSPESCELIAEVFHTDVDEVLTRAGHRPRDLDIDPDSPPERFHAMMKRIKWDTQREQLVEAMLRQMLEFDRAHPGES
jgi:transcriptional regulator with XRE-family HTH domain